MNSPRGGRKNNRGRGGAQRGDRGRGATLTHSHRSMRGRGSGGIYRNLEELDVQIQIYPDETSDRGSVPYRGRGRGRGGLGSGINTPNAQGSPRGRGSLSGRATPTRGGGRGRGFNRFDQNMPLAKLLDMDRPLLKPIVFVRAQINPILFQRHEEILEVPEESTQVDDHVPTADRVTRVFSGQSAPPNFQLSSDDDINGDSQGPDEAENIPVVDFHSLGELLGSDLVNEHKLSYSQENANEPRFLGRGASTAVNVTSPPDNAPAEAAGFYIDVKPSSPGSQPPNSISVNRIDTERPLGSATPDDGDDDVIVYVAPHPRSGKATPAPPSHNEPAQSPAALTSPLTSTVSESNPGAVSTTVSTVTSVSTFTTVSPVPSTSTTTPAPPALLSPLPTTAAKPQLLDSVSLSFDRIAQSTSQNRKLRQFAASPRSRVLTKKGRQGAARKMKSAMMFGSFGAMREEAELRDARLQSRDPRRDEQRRGDSDVDWGDGEDPHTLITGGDVDVDELSNGLGGMDLDPELDPDSAALKRFVLGMAKAQHMTIDDLADAEKLKLEDEDDEDASASEGSSNDSELDVVVDEEERVIIAEDGGPLPMAIKPSDDDEGLEEEGSDDGSSSDDDDTPKRGFQARLSKIRQHSNSRNGKGKKSDNVPDTDSSKEDDFDRMFTWADKDEDFIDKIQDVVDGHDWKLQGRDRRQKKALFDAVQNGSFTYVEPSPAARRKDKSIPEHLQEQWEKDRAKKAAWKRERERERMEAAADVFTSHRKGKKARKAILRAATYDFDDFDSDDDSGRPPHGRVVDMPSLVMQIRAFVADIGGKPTIALPPMDKAARKQVHEMAIAFNLKSKSVGKGKSRYTTLIRTSRTGLGIDERKIGRIMKRGGGDGQFGRPYERNGGGGAPPPRHKEGDVVGKAAPKIGQGNIGFKMLASMGWAEGDRIGVTGGLDAPLTAIMKTSKLGLGHTLSKKS